MPVIPLDTLIDEAGLKAFALRVVRSKPGLVIATGQTRSGKVTTLTTLALEIAGPRPVAVVTDRKVALESFRPLPEGWREVLIEDSASAWASALGSAAVTEAHVVVLFPLGNESVSALLAAPPDRWILAAIDTALIGVDAAYALQEMGFPNEALLERGRAIWSQFLVGRLCEACARPVRLSDAEMDYLFPTEPLMMEVKAEAGCPECGGKGTRGREAIAEVLLVEDATRAALKAALADGAPPRLGRDHHLTAQAHARDMVARGTIGIGTYRDEIRRNPFLRAQNQVEREQSRSFRLDLASRHKSEFLANMSHELRTPLNAIIGFSEVLLSGMAGPLDDRQKEFIGDIHGSGKHLLALINDILDMSKIEAGKMELEIAAFELPATIGNAITLVSARAERHGIRLASEIGPGVGTCEGDERKVKQILLNLLTNAVKFTPEGGTVTVAARVAGSAYELSVSDTGIGIAPEDQEAVFEEFRQVGPKHAGKAEGTGLGLSLTRRLVELHGGAIRLSSTPGKGATFTVTLPSRR